MIYVLVFIQFLNTDNLRFYQIATFPEMSQCQEEKRKRAYEKPHKPRAFVFGDSDPLQ